MKYEAMQPHTEQMGDRWVCLVCAWRWRRTTRWRSHWTRWWRPNVDQWSNQRLTGKWSADRVNGKKVFSEFFQEFKFEMLKTERYSLCCTSANEDTATKPRPLSELCYWTEQGGKKMKVKKKTTTVTELQNQKHRKGNLEITEKKQSQRKEKKRDDSCSQGGTCCFKIPTCCLFWICNALWKQKGTKRSSLSKERRERDRDRSKYRQINETRDRKKTLITRSEMRLERGTRLWNAHRGN